MISSTPSPQSTQVLKTTYNWEYPNRLCFITALRFTSVCSTIKGIHSAALHHYVVCTLHCTQYLNCRGDAEGRVPLSRVSVPPSRFSVPPSRFRRPPIEIWALGDETYKSQPARINPTNPGRIQSRIAVKTFFFMVFTWFRGKTLHF